MDTKQLEKAIRNNKKLGNNFEENLSILLSRRGFWVAPFPNKNHTNSQPADLIAIRYNKTSLIECKTLENKSGLFPLSRIEENQILAFKRLKECGNCCYNLAILWEDTVYFIPFDSIDFNQKSIDLKNQIPFIRKFNEVINENLCR